MSKITSYVSLGVGFYAMMRIVSILKFQEICFNSQELLQDPHHLRETRSRVMAFRQAASGPSFVAWFI